MRNIDKLYKEVKKRLPNLMPSEVIKVVDLIIDERQQAYKEGGMKAMDIMKGVLDEK